MRNGKPREEGTKITRRSATGAGVAAPSTPRCQQLVRDCRNENRNRNLKKGRRNSWKHRNYRTIPGLEFWSSHLILNNKQSQQSEKRDRRNVGGGGAAGVLDGGGEGLLSLAEQVLGQHPHLGDLVVEDGVRGVGGDVDVAVVLVAAGHAHLQQDKRLPKNVQRILRNAPFGSRSRRSPPCSSGTPCRWCTSCWPARWCPSSPWCARCGRKSLLQIELPLSIRPDWICQFALKPARIPRNFVKDGDTGAETFLMKPNPLWSRYLKENFHFKCAWTINPLSF